MQKATQKAIDMNVNVGGIIGKLESNADKLGMAVGAFTHLQSYGGGDPIKAVTNLAEGIMKTPHIPDLSNVVAALLNTGAEGQFFIPAAEAAILGYGLEFINLDPKLTRIGKALSKAGVGAATAIAAITVVAYSGVAHSPNPLMNGGGGGGGAPAQGYSY